MKKQFTVSDSERVWCVERGEIRLVSLEELEADNKRLAMIIKKQQHES